jgi:hypothetical protein
MNLATDKMRFVQNQLGYDFDNIDRLHLCFRAAHRSDLDGIYDDGNRAFAQFGVTVMEMVEKRCSSIIRLEPRRKHVRKSLCQK